MWIVSVKKLATAILDEWLFIAIILFAACPPQAASSHLAVAVLFL
jgi:hypothetical protein